MPFFFRGAGGGGHFPFDHSTLPIRFHRPYASILSRPTLKYAQAGWSLSSCGSVILDYWKRP